MSGGVALAVLLTAVLHASWNALAKLVPDRLAASVGIGGTFLVAGLVGVWFVPLPVAAAWPYLLASAVLQTLYLLLLTKAYSLGDFAVIYPLARGLAPLLVALVAALVLHERLTPLQLIGVVTVSAALSGMVFAGGRPDLGRGIWYAAGAGVTIASYTMLDGAGVRVAGDVGSYAAMLFLLHGAMMIPAAAWLARRAGRLPQLRAGLAGHWRTAVAGGVISVIAYAIVVWAQARAPLAMVSALRETSVLFAGIIGALVFKERFSAARTVLTVAAVAGLAAIQLG